MDKFIVTAAGTIFKVKDTKYWALRTVGDNTLLMAYGYNGGESAMVACESLGCNIDVCHNHLISFLSDADVSVLDFQKFVTVKS